MFQTALSEQWEMYGTVREEQLRVRLRERIHGEHCETGEIQFSVHLQDCFKLTL